MFDNKAEIEKLSRKLAQNPTSKFFIPLGEEYANAGLYDEAISVLQKGLANYPDYPSARVALGKVYMKKGMLLEAKSEFESVLKGNPDNLFCYRRLAGIYKECGEFEKAVDACKKVLILNPKDSEMLGILEEIEQTTETQDESLEIFNMVEEPEEGVQSAGESEPEEDEEPAGLENESTGLFAVLENEAPAALFEEPDDTEVQEPQSNISVRDYIDFPVNEEPVVQEAAEDMESPEDEGETAGGLEDRIEDISFLIKEIQEDEPPSGVIADEEPPGDIRAEEEDIFTPSIAELYIQQGDIKRGIAIYRRLSEAEPGIFRYRKRLSELEEDFREEPPSAAPGQQAEPSAAGAVETPPPPQVEIPPVIPAATDEIAEKEPIKEIKEEEEPPLSEKGEKINRLEVWLKTVRREKGRR